MRQILVTGGCGFIGTNLIELLLGETHWKIRILDNLKVSGRERVERLPNFDSARVVFIEGDVRNKDDVGNAVKGCDCVVNLAAQTGVMSSMEDPVKDAEVNIFGLLNLLQASVKHDVKNFVQASSAAPLGEQEPPLDENMVPRPLSPYGASKLACEGYCSAYYGSFGLRTVCLRFSNVYGIHSDKKQSAIHKFVRLIIDDKPLVIYGDGKQTRDFVNAKDIANAIKLAIEKNAQGLYQIGTGKETSLLELLDTIKEVSGKEPIVEFKEERPGEIKRNYVKIDKAKNELGYVPKITLREGLSEMYSWYENLMK